MGKKFFCLGFVGAMLVAVSLAGSAALAADTIKREAEAADSISAPMKIYSDPLASAGRYIGTDEGSGDQNSNPPTAGVAQYNFTAKGGVYKIFFRVSIANGSNSLWVRIVGATRYTPGTHASGWIRFNDISDGAAWHWDEVHSSDHSNQVVNITLPAGQHTLEIARREDGAKLDGFIITDDLNMNQATLPDVIDPGPKAWGPDPADGKVGVTMPLLQWKPGNGAIFHDVYLGTSPELTIADRVATLQPLPAVVYFHLPGLEPGVTYYWRVDEIGGDMVTVQTGDVWRFTTEPLQAYLPQPADGAAGLLPGLNLSWTRGKEGLGSHLYFGSDKTAVANGDASTDQGNVTDLPFNTGALRASTTYFWRVDTLKLDGSVMPGDVWSFTTVDGGPAGKILREWWLGISGTAISALLADPRYPTQPSGSEYVNEFEGLVDWADNYGTRFYGWLKPPDTADYTFWIAGDDAQELWLSTDESPSNAAVIARVGAWTNSREWTKEAGQKSAAISLKAGQKYFIMALGKEGGGGDSTAVAWQGGSIANQEIIKGQYVDMVGLLPLQAYGPLPANRQVDAPQAPDLTWNAGEKATEHSVYFGDDEAAVAAADASSGLFKGTQTGTSFSPGNLEWNKTYYWRIDETDGTQTWRGNVWSFTTANFIPVEDFESYNDEENQGTRIYETWLDGLTNGTTSTVGNWDPPFAERKIVHDGKQSMPLDYNNINAPYYAEGEREFAPLMNWTINDVNALSLWYRGQPPTFFEAADGLITMAGSGHDIWDNADDFRFAYKRVTGNASITVKVESIGNTNTWAKAGVMIRESLDADSKFAYTIVSAGQGVSFGWRTLTAGGCDSRTQSGLAAPYWVKLTRTGDAFTAQYSADGTTWTDMKNSDGTVASAPVAMTGNIYIGLAVTSHDAALVTSGSFRSPSTTGNVTAGPWQVAAIGDDPQPANAPDSLYVVVEDSAGKTKAVTNPDPGAALTTTWTEWKIPLTDLAGVNLGKVKKLYIGVGDRQATVPTGGGRIYIDDIRVTK